MTDNRDVTTGMQDSTPTRPDASAGRRNSLNKLLDKIKKPFQHESKDPMSNQSGQQGSTFKQNTFDNEAERADPTANVGGSNVMHDAPLGSQPVNQPFSNQPR